MNITYINTSVKQKNKMFCNYENDMGDHRISKQKQESQRRSGEDLSDQT